MAEEFVQTNVSLTAEDRFFIDRMMNMDGYEKVSPFVRWLIRQEYARRFGVATPALPASDEDQQPMHVQV